MLQEIEEEIWKLFFLQGGEKILGQLVPGLADSPLFPSTMRGLPRGLDMKATLCQHDW